MGSIYVIKYTCLRGKPISGLKKCFRAPPSFGLFRHHGTRSIIGWIRAGPIVNLNLHRALNPLHRRLFLNTYKQL